MPYYSDNKILFLVDGIEVYMTEMEAEFFQAQNPHADIQCPGTIIIPEEEVHDFLDCTCQPDPPEGTAPLCPSCREFFRNLLEDE